MRAKSTYKVTDTIAVPITDNESNLQYNYTIHGTPLFISYLTTPNMINQLQFKPIIIPAYNRTTHNANVASLSWSHAIGLAEPLDDDNAPRYIVIIYVQQCDIDSYYPYLDYRYHLLVGVDISGIQIGATRLSNY